MSTTPAHVFIATFELRHEGPEAVGVALSPEGAMDLANAHATKSGYREPKWEQRMTLDDGEVVTYRDGDVGLSWGSYLVAQHELRP